MAGPVCGNLSHSTLCQCALHAVNQQNWTSTTPGSVYMGVGQLGQPPSTSPDYPKFCTGCGSELKWAQTGKPKFSETTGTIIFRRVLRCPKGSWFWRRFGRKAEHLIISRGGGPEHRGGPWLQHHRREDAPLEQI